jgi:hypothetical protein
MSSRFSARGLAFQRPADHAEPPWQVQALRVSLFRSECATRSSNARSILMAYFKGWNRKYMDIIRPASKSSDLFSQALSHYLYLPAGRTPL